MLKQTLRSTLRLASHTLDTIKVRDCDDDIYCFITTKSIQRELALSLQPQGSLLNTDVVDIQALFDVVESQGEHELFAYMESTLEYTAHELVVADIVVEVRKYCGGELFVTLDEANKYANTTSPTILKLVCFTLDETPLLRLVHFKQILAHRPRPHISKQLRKIRVKKRKSFSQL